MEKIMGELDFSDMTMDQLLEFASKCKEMLPEGFRRRFNQVQRTNSKKYDDFGLALTRSNYLVGYGKNGKVKVASGHL